MSMCSICKTGYEESAQGVCPNCGANVAFQREARRLRGVTDFVKSWWPLMMISNGVLLVATWQVRAGLNPCSWFDTRLARSGCVAKVTVDEAASVEAIFTAHVQPMVFSPDGQTLAVPRLAMLLNEEGRRTRGPVIPLMSLESGEVLHVLRVDETAIETGAPVMPDTGAKDTVFSPDGTLLAASVPQDGTHVVYLWTVETGERQWRIRVENCPEPVFSPDGQFVLCAERRLAIADGTVSALRENDVPSQLSVAEVLAVDKGTAPPVWGQGISPDQTLKAENVGSNLIQISRIEGDGASRLVELEADVGFGDGLYFSPDSQQLIAFGRGKGAIYLWQRGSDRFEKLPILDTVSSLAWSQDGEHVGVAVSGMQNTLLVHEVSQMPRL